MIPYDVPENYRVVADIQPAAKTSVPQIVLVVGERIAPVVLDGNNSYCAIIGVDVPPS